ncbi:HAD family hydrolase [Salinadaptatus halalkaliphilus]|uniref:HAD family hydrolase n=1 Tax=Salinadaptatus halalkaliphilus TaxID=2419781 RepID=UPI001FE26F89|nr:HAD family hydrolase [Salinadaptatus halalkaliphilus]
MEAISFDLDDTLLQYNRSPGEVLQAAFDRLELSPIFSVEQYYDRFDEFAQRCESITELRSECFATLAAENGYERHQGREVAAAFSSERDQSNVELLPAATRVLATLSQEYQLAIVTNGTRDAQRRKIEAVDLERWIDTIVVAGHETQPKPDPEPFDRVVHSLGTAPETTIHVGDSLETDVAGATAAGLDSVWLSESSPPPQFDPTYRIPSLEALLSSPNDILL